jgi:hypothetical protein
MQEKEHSLKERVTLTTILKIYSDLARVFRLIMEREISKERAKMSRNLKM